MKITDDRMSTEDNAKYHFTFVPKKKLDILNEKNVKPYLKKWGLAGRIQSQYFAFNESVHLQDMNEFLKEFFTSPDVYPHLRSHPSIPITQPLSKLRLTRVPCTQTDLQLLARLTDPANGVVIREFDLRQCLHTEVDGFLVGDELRKLLLDPDEDSTLYSDAERSEFLFSLFRHCCLGGQYCQYEDSVEPYLNVTKLLYKNLVSVVRCSVTGNILVQSLVYRVQARHEDSDVATFPLDPDQDNNFAYVIVDPHRKYVTTLVHQAGWSEDG